MSVSASLLLASLMATVACRSEAASETANTRPLTQAAMQQDASDKTRGNGDQPPMKYNELTDFEKYVILKKGTERAYTGKFTDHEARGTYICRRCNAALYKSDAKFHSNCGWPAFDDEIEGAVMRVPDADGMRTEILCSNCGGHLGHVFLGEGFTEKNTRHCVNSVSMDFVPEGKKLPEPIKGPASRK